MLVAALVRPGRPLHELAVPPSLRVLDPADVLASADGLDPEGGHVLLLAERRHEPAVRRAAAVLRDGGVPVAWLVLDHGPLALLFVASQVAEAGLEPATAVEFAEELATSTWSGAWMPGVAKLPHPQVSLARHLRSWLPGGAGYVVTYSGPSPSVVPVGGETAPAEPVVARGELYGDGIERLSPATRETLLDVSGASGIVEVTGVEVGDASAERSGSASAVELVAFPAADRLEIPVAQAPCAVCGVLTFSDFCRFCHVRPLAVAPRGALA